MTFEPEFWATTPVRARCHSCLPEEPCFEHRFFRCPRCGLWVPWSKGAADGPECDDCWAKGAAS
jgi:hypothetical protein